MNPTKINPIQRQSIHECIVENYQQNTPISKDDYFEIGLSLLESVSGFENYSYTNQANTLETICTGCNSTLQGGYRVYNKSFEPMPAYGCQATDQFENIEARLGAF